MSTPTKSKSSSDRESYWSVPLPIPKPKIGLEYRFPNPNTTGAKSEIRKTIRKRIDVANTDTNFFVHIPIKSLFIYSISCFRVSEPTFSVF